MIIAIFHYFSEMIYRINFTFTQYFNCSFIVCLDYLQKFQQLQINYFGALHLYFYSGYYFYQYNGALHLSTKGQSADILVENTSRKSTKVQRTEI